jgi:hypothetical protein
MSAINSNVISEGGNREWNGYQKIFFRFAFIYFLLQIVPLDWRYFQQLFSINWFHSHFYDLLLLSAYYPTWGLPGFYSWLVIIAVAFVGAVVWTFYDKGRTPEYNNLYYWLRVLLRYRLAVGVIGFGLIKLFVLQIPFPSLSNLHTTYGQFLPWKIYYNSIGIVPWYESFLGGVEILTGLLLLHRNTTTFGAGILVGFLGNVLAANFAYDLGEQVYSAYLIVIAVFLLGNDVPRLYSLLILQRYTLAEKFIPFFDANVKKARIILKSLFVVFVLIFGFRSYSNSRHHPYLIPQTAGLAGSYGYYDVKEFRLNHQTIPYSLTDTSRWQNVVFEKWATLSVKIAKPIKIDLSKADGFYNDDMDRTYEQAGAGERLYYSYTTDTLNHILLLHNKNPNYRSDSLLLHYSRPDTSTIILSGTNEQRDSISVALNKVVKKYLFYIGRRQPVKF